MARAIRLTKDLVARGLAAFPPGTIGPPPEGRRAAADADYFDMAQKVTESRPDGDFWVFAYGSLLWKPCFDHVESRIATVRSWHRTFRLGYDRWFRGSVERPGLMMVLDRGGSCKGMAYRLPPEAMAENIDRLLRREIRFVPSSQFPRWLNVQTDHGSLQALAFAVDRKAPAYVGRLPQEKIAEMIAIASGSIGSMPEYLLNTIEHLEALGIHDRMLWELQDLVARRIEELTAT